MTRQTPGPGTLTLPGLEDVGLSPIRRQYLELKKGEKVRHQFRAGRLGWVQIARGSVEIDGQTLEQGDGAALEGIDSLAIQAVDSFGAPKGLGPYREGTFPLAPARQPGSGRNASGCAQGARAAAANSSIMVFHPYGSAGDRSPAKHDVRPESDRLPADPWQDLGCRGPAESNRPC